MKHLSGFRHYLAAVLVCFSASFATRHNASATLPVVVSLEPRGVVRGEETVVKLNGTRLADASEVLCDLPGIEILEVTAVSNSVTEVKLRAAADLTPGL